MVLRMYDLCGIFCRILWTSINNRNQYLYSVLYKKCTSENEYSKEFTVHTHRLKLTDAVSLSNILLGSDCLLVVNIFPGGSSMKIFPSVLVSIHIA